MWLLRSSRLPKVLFIWWRHVFQFEKASSEVLPLACLPPWFPTHRAVFKVQSGYQCLVGVGRRRRQNSGGWQWRGDRMHCESGTSEPVILSSHMFLWFFSPHSFNSLLKFPSISRPGLTTFYLKAQASPHQWWSLCLFCSADHPWTCCVMFHLFIDCFIAIGYWLYGLLCVFAPYYIPGAKNSSA